MRGRSDPAARPHPAAGFVSGGSRPTRHDEPGTAAGQPGPELTLTPARPVPVPVDPDAEVSSPGCTGSKLIGWGPKPEVVTTDNASHSCPERGRCTTAA